ncbi:hypothetical protein F5884DRAFT_876558 [Xylogone sp. PMI_703]|nr:hypothetical protein F5884DRAFT_876558 [Xylogone sp. PMI_703]
MARSRGDDESMNDKSSTIVRQITPDLTTLSFPFSQLGFLKSGGRTTLVRLRSGSLIVISACKLTDSVRAAIATTEGHVRYIVAPNLEHYLHIASWKAAYPEAKLVAPGLLREKCGKNPALQEVQFDILFTSSDKHPHISDEFDNEISIEFIASMASQEIILFHKPSSTLIEADLLFNLPAIEQFSRSGTSPTSGVLSKLVAPLFSAKASATWQKRLGWYVLSSKDRNGFGKSLERINSWEFDRIIPCHGDVVENGAKQTFQLVFEWFLEGPGKRI